MATEKQGKSQSKQPPLLGTESTKSSPGKAGAVMDKLEPLAVSAPEAARLLGVSKPTVYQYIHRDDFPAFKLGNRTLVSVDGLKEWIRKQVNEQ
jgi:DNA binding domain, excisionase family